MKKATVNSLFVLLFVIYTFIVYKDEIHNGTLIYGSFSNNCVGINTCDLTMAPSSMT